MIKWDSSGGGCTRNSLWYRVEFPFIRVCIQSAGMEFSRVVHCPRGILSCLVGVEKCVLYEFIQQSGSPGEGSVWFGVFGYSG